MIISFVNTKGGVAKTTSAILLGIALSKYGSVRVYDSDPQGSAESWAGRAEDSGKPLPFDVLPATQTTLQKLGRVKEDYVLVDTPPGNAGIINTAIEIADLVVIPTDASPLDIERTWSTYDACEGHARVILLAQVDQRTTMFKEARDVMGEEDVAVFDTIIKRRQAYKTAGASGHIPADLTDYDDLAKEIRDLMEEK